MLLREVEVLLVPRRNMLLVILYVLPAISLAVFSLIRAGGVATFDNIPSKV